MGQVGKISFGSRRNVNAPMRLLGLGFRVLQQAVHHNHKNFA